MTESGTQPNRAPLSASERRVLGVLVEKQKTTPENYPMTITAITTACNQKSNRDPVTNYDADDVEQVLQKLRLKGAVVRIEGSGRTEKWRHNLYEWWDLRNRAAQMSIIAELMLRGPQTEGELRGRASRMDAIDDLSTLQTHLQALIESGMVVYLTPAEQKRGAIVSHNLYPPEELERLRVAVASHARTSDAREPVEAGPSRLQLLQEEVQGLKSQIEELRDQLSSVKQTVDQLRSALGD